MKSVFAGVLAFAITGCVDSVPSIQDPHNIILEGKSMSQQEFLEKYCVGKAQHETCNKVYRAMIVDSTKSKNGIVRF